MVYLATKTIAAIDGAIKSDQGASFRVKLGEVLPHISDAYSPDNFPFRSHMGASLIGDSCAKKIWYGFRWTTRPVFEGRLLRLFNRGHSEEGRFIAMLLMIGCRVYQQDGDGNQFRISDAGGHYGGSGDGIAYDIPDLDPGTKALLEFKTSGEKPFVKLKKEGVRIAKSEHFVQMQQYMGKMGLGVALYMCVNKNTDELYGELIAFDHRVYEQYLDRAIKLVGLDSPPEGISKSPGWFECKWCDHNKVCFGKSAPEKTCRSCTKVQCTDDGKWLCTDSGELLDKHAQLKACTDYQKSF